MEKPVQEVAVKCLHCAKVVIHHRSRWQDMIPPLGYKNLGERHLRTLKIICSSTRRYGKKNR
jgi:hypothetical protein